MHSFCVGDRVRLVATRPDNLQYDLTTRSWWTLSETGFMAAWVGPHEVLAGEEGEIVTINDLSGGIEVKFMDAHIWVLPAWLESVVVVVNRCVCDTFNLVWRGCQCGQFQREMTGRNS